MDHLARMGDAEGASIHERVKQHIALLEQRPQASR